MALRESELLLVPSSSEIEQIGNGKDLKDFHPTSRSRSQIFADTCFRDVASMPSSPAKVYAGPRAIDELGRSKLGSMVRGDALGFEIRGSERILRDIFEFDETKLELRRKAEGMIPFVDELRSGDFLTELFGRLKITGKPVVERTDTISLIFIRRYAPIDTVYEYSQFARVSVQNLGNWYARKI